MRRLAAALGIGLLVSGPLQAGCLTQVQVDHLMHHLIPLAIDGISKHCRPSLPADAFVVRSGPALVERLRASGQPDPAELRQIFDAISPTPLPKSVSNGTLIRMFDEEMPGELHIDHITPDECADYNQIVEGLSPLPPESLYLAVGGIMRDVARKDQNIHICPATHS